MHSALYTAYTSCVNNNLNRTAEAVLEVFHFDHTERSITYLPLSHIAAQMLDIHGPMSMGSHVYFAQPDALRGSLGATLKAVRPTFFFGVPRVWEKVTNRFL
jgi:long-chain-fatty-acid--CoA ligase ACSBG